MKRRILFAIISFLSYLHACHQTMIPKLGFCFLTGSFVQTMGHAFYEMVDEVDDLESKYEVYGPTPKYVPRTATTTSEKPIPDEWKIRGTYRVACVEETKILPSKVVRLMAGRSWTGIDTDLQRWVLCVLQKMGLMSKQGVFKMDVALSKIPSRDRKFAEALIDVCLPKQALQPHQIAWQYVKCHNKAQGNFSAISVF